MGQVFNLPFKRANVPMERFRELLTDLWRPWHTSCLLEELDLPDEPVTVLDASKMLRDARMGAACDLELGIFQILGVEEARRATGIWWPATRIVTEEVALAFRLVEKQRLTGEIVSGHNINRLTETLYAYFASMGRPKTRDEICRQIDAFLAEHSLPAAKGMSPIRRPITVELPLLNQLHEIDGEVQSRFMGMHNRPASLGCVGLILDAKMDDSRYEHCTPLNCRTFASTGGDGAHFSLFVQDGAITGTSPVAVTASDAFGNPSVVAAESLYDFLCMGCVKGYFALGHVLHGPEQNLRKYFGPEGELPVSDLISDDYQYQVLALLRDRLGLKPWTDWRSLREIQARYQPQLRHPPGAIF